MASSLKLAQEKASGHVRLSRCTQDIGTVWDLLKRGESVAMPMNYRTGKRWRQSQLYAVLS